VFVLLMAVLNNNSILNKLRFLVGEITKMLGDSSILDGNESTFVRQLVYRPT
jgi:hypothetical protein